MIFEEAYDWDRLSGYETLAGPRGARKTLDRSP